MVITYKKFAKNPKFMKFKAKNGFLHLFRKIPTESMRLIWTNFRIWKDFQSQKEETRQILILYIFIPHFMAYYKHYDHNL